MQHQQLVAVACGVQGMIVLDYACDNAMDSAEEPLDLWATIEVSITPALPCTSASISDDV